MLQYQPDLFEERNQRVRFGDHLKAAQGGVNFCHIGNLLDVADRETVEEVHQDHQNHEYEPHVHGEGEDVGQGPVLLHDHGAQIGVFGLDLAHGHGKHLEDGQEGVVEEWKLGTRLAPSMVPVKKVNSLMPACLMFWK